MESACGPQSRHTKAVIIRPTEFSRPDLKSCSARPKCPVAEHGGLRIGKNDERRPFFVPSVLWATFIGRRVVSQGPTALSNGLINGESKINRHAIRTVHANSGPETREERTLLSFSFTTNSFLHILTKLWNTSFVCTHVSKACGFIQATICLHTCRRPAPFKKLYVYTCVEDLLHLRNYIFIHGLTACSI